MRRSRVFQTLYGLVLCAGVCITARANHAISTAPDLAFSPLKDFRCQLQSGLPPVAPAARRQYVAVLVWHDVLPKKQVWFDTTVATFKAQLEAIKRGNFHVVTLQELLQHLQRGTSLPPRPLAFTFDDNNRGLYRYAFPLLKQYHYPATLFVHTEYVGVTTSKEHNNWNELAEMERSGLIGVQSLTASHPADIRTFTDAAILKELRDSRASLEKHLGQPIYAFVYPEDRYDARVAQLVAQSNYRIAFTEDWGDASASPNLMMVHRYSILKRFAQALADVARAYRQ
jgi:peptidoglycan/xylan/chitin deacetylase (PgdA/CDA1 family)